MVELADSSAGLRRIVDVGTTRLAATAGGPHLRVLWAWSLFVVGGMVFQKTSEHWQVVVLPAFLRDLRSGARPMARRPILAATIATVVAAALVAVALSHSVVAVSVLSRPRSSRFSRGRPPRQSPRDACRGCPARRTSRAWWGATMFVMTGVAAVWFGSVTAHAPGFVGAAQLAVVATFMLLGTALAAGSIKSLPG